LVHDIILYDLENNKTMEKGREGERINSNHNGNKVLPSLNSPNNENVHTVYVPSYRKKTVTGDVSGTTIRDKTE
jgi:hypothetical protein